MAAKHAGILAYAKALHYWQHRHAFCGVCGNPNLLRSAGHRMVCSNEECERESFPRIDPAIIVLVTNRDACLLGRNAKWRPRHFSTLAGFVEPGETLEEAVAREVAEEVGLRFDPGQVFYQSSQPWPFPSSLMLGFHARIEPAELRVNRAEIESAAWFSREDLLNSPEDESFRLPRADSIARRLIEDWLAEAC